MTTFCRNCGLPESSLPGLSGCTQDTVLAHEFVDPADRPFRDWTPDDIWARFDRAEQKAQSAAMTAEHAAVCPTLGKDSYVYELYTEKTLKRRNLANQLMRELVERAHELKATERPFSLR